MSGSEFDPLHSVEAVRRKKTVLQYETRANH